jgi:hypothetical protein
VQVDVVGINWAKKEILVGECKWGTDAVSREVLQELHEVKLPRLLKDLPEEGEGWQSHTIAFSRAGFTSAAQGLAKANKTMLIDLAQLDRDLSKVG